MVSRAFEICIANQYNGNEEIFSMRPNLRRLEYFQEDLFNRRPDLRYQQMKMYYQSFGWVKSCDRLGIPEDAVIAGYDVDGSAIYVGRAFHNGHFIPAKVIPSKRIAYVPWKGCEHSTRNYEFLCGTNFEWIKCSHGNIQPGAICAGKQLDGVPMYVGRANIGGSVAVGKVHIKYNCIYVPFNGREHSLTHYEVLVEKRRGLNWMRTNESYGYPVDAISAGYDVDGSTICVGRAYHNDHYIPAKVIPSKRIAYISWGGSEYIKRDYELLCGTSFQWIKCSNGHAPPRAVMAGKDQGVPLYVGRAHVGGSLAVGKVHEKYGFLYVPFNGTEHEIRNYEVLVDLGSNRGGSNVYINNEADFCTFLNQNINKLYIEKYNATTSASYSPQPSRLRHNVNCTGCGNEIYDIRYKCMECSDVNLCMKCEPKIHKQHLMVRITNPYDEPIFAEKAAPTNQSWTTFDKAEVKEAYRHEKGRHEKLDTDLQTGLIRLGLAGLKILMSDSETKDMSEVKNNAKSSGKESAPPPYQATQTAQMHTQSFQPPYQAPQMAQMHTQSAQQQTQSAPQPMFYPEPHVATPIYPQLPIQPQVQSLPLTTSQPIAQFVSGTASQPMNQSLPQTTFEVKIQTVPQTISESATKPTAPPMPDPAPLHPDARVNDGLKTMIAMGFSNEGGWLARLLQSVDGNVGKALDLMQNKK